MGFIGGPGGGGSEVLRNFGVLIHIHVVLFIYSFWVWLFCTWGSTVLALLFVVLSFINPFNFVWPSSFFNFRLDDMSMCYPLSG